MSNDVTAAEGLGTDLAIDLYDCASPDIDDIAWIRDALLRAADIIGANVVNDCLHRFQPHGVSGVVVISESHIAIHTWPEHRFVAIDVFTCGSMSRLDDAVRFLKVRFAAGEAKVVATARGVGVAAARGVAKTPEVWTPVAQQGE